jgi:hypothetical protein
MTFLGNALFAVGVLELVAGYLVSLRVIFEDSRARGIMCLLMPGMILYVLLFFTSFERAWPFLLLIFSGFFMMMGGLMLMRE